MTYLEIVNKVLVRLRENTVSTWDQTTYSTMVGAFINDAKKECEDAWNWSANREILSLSTSASTENLTLTGFGLDSVILSSHNDTQNGEFVYRSQSWFDHKKYTSEVPEGSPDRYTFRGSDGTDAIIQMHPIPDAVYALKFNVCVTQDELAADATELQIPWRPVMLLAVALLSDEKGETGTTQSLRLERTAMKSLSDHIAYDASLNPLETIWQEV